MLSPTELIGRVISHYRITAQIGSGGGFQWTPDGSALIAIAIGDDGVGDLERIPIDGGARSVISHFTAAERLRRLAVNGDGRVAFSRGTVDNEVVLLTVGR